VKDQEFYPRLGRQIAEQRNAVGLTQTDLAQELGVALHTMAHYEGDTARIAVAMLPAMLGELISVTQQQIASFETGRRRMPISTLPLLAKALGGSIEELVGEQPRLGKHVPAPMLQQLEQLQALPGAKQRLVSEVLD
jgi:transcriptional regulator with XRE-family HTH domain